MFSQVFFNFSVVAFGPFFFFMKVHLFIYLFWLHWVFLAVLGLPLVVVSTGYSLGSVRGLLIAVVSLITEHQLQGTQAH